MNDIVEDTTIPAQWMSTLRSQEMKALRLLLLMRAVMFARKKCMIANCGKEGKCPRR